VAAVNELNLAALLIVKSYEGDVFLAIDAGAEKRVDGSDRVDKEDVAAGLGVHHALDDGGEGSSRHAFAGDVGDDSDEAVFDGDDIVEVAADLGARDGFGHDLSVGEAREVAGDDALLNRSSDLHLVAEEVGGALGLNQAGIFDEVAASVAMAWRISRPTRFRVLVRRRLSR
jgi:hypothetical protein